MHTQTPRPTASGNLTHYTVDLQGKRETSGLTTGARESQLIYKVQNKLFFRQAKKLEETRKSEWRHIEKNTENRRPSKD